MTTAPDPMKPSVLYRSYLLRLWQDDPNGVLRASLHHVQSGEVVRFATVTALLAYLHEQEKTICSEPLPEGGK